MQACQYMSSPFWNYAYTSSWVSATAFASPDTDLMVAEDNEPNADNISELSFLQSNASSHTSHDGEVSIRTVSPAPTFYTITESLAEGLFRTEHGREINTTSSIYRLPADAMELERLDKQHVILTRTMGKFAPPMDEVMAPGDHGIPKMVLDLGCGSGAWFVRLTL